MNGHILLCPNAHRDAGLAATRHAAELLRSHGHKVVISPFLSEGLEDTWQADEKLQLLLAPNGTGAPTADLMEGTVEAEGDAEVAAVPSSRTEAAVAPERDDNENVAASYTFDIKVLGVDGAELQPANGNLVRVSFAAAEVADPNLEVSVYHVSGGEAEELAVSESGTTATATSKGFSYYTVEFTYGDLQYVLQGGGSVPLADVLATVGLQGEPTAAASSDLHTRG